MNTVEYIYNDLKRMIDSIVIKYERTAKEHEDLESRKASDVYIAAKLEIDTFDSHVRFSKDAIRNSEIFDENIVELYHTKKREIPHHLRERVLKEERFLTITNYVEKNNYYRELSGLPNTDEVNFIYLPIEICRKFNLNSKTPIHEYRDDELYPLEKEIIPGLIKQYPDKGYLKFLGSKSVDLVKARRAKNFEIIQNDYNFDNVFIKHFFSTYNTCREYFVSVIHVKEFSHKYDLYDNFIAMNIMIMCIQRMMVNTLKIGIERDFYDLPSIKALFDSYGVPFFEDLPLDYQRALMKNLNMLLRYKSTDKVLYDISSILFFDRIKIFKYFLVKDRNFDDRNNPIFAYKEIEDEFGNKQMVEDVEKMYSFYFQSTDILERNTALALENNQTKLDFLEVTENDTMWWNDEDLQKVMYEQEYNYVETKYLSVNIMYKMTQMMFESIYALNMMTDKKDTRTSKIFISIPRVTLEKVSVFDSLILLFALTCKKNGMKGEIINEPTKILSVMGFNFKADFKAIRETILANPRLYGNEVAQYIVDMDLSTPKDINDMYNNIKNLADFCVDRMNSTTSINVYRAFKDLYEALMVKEYTSEILTKRNGKVATTYLDYLKDSVPHLGEFVENCSKEKTSIVIKHVLGKLNELIPDLEYMSASEGTDSTLIKALMKLIEFFKSYTVDLDSLNVLYLMDSKYYNMIRMVHDINHLSKIMSVSEVGFREYFDTVATHVNLTRNDRIEFIYKYFVECKSLFKYLMHTHDTEYINKIIESSDKPTITDEDREMIYKIIEDEDKTHLDSSQEYHISIDNFKSLTMKEIIKEMITNIFINEHVNLIMYNDFIEARKENDAVDRIQIDNFVSFFSDLFINEFIPSDEKVEYLSRVDIKESLNEHYSDILGIDSIAVAKSEANINDLGKVLISFHREDGWFGGMLNKLHNHKSVAEIRLTLQMYNIMKTLSHMNIKYDMTPIEWSMIHNEYSIIEKGIREDTMTFDISLLETNRVLSRNIEVCRCISDISTRFNIKASDVCKVYQTVSRNDSMTFLEKCKYKISSLLTGKSIVTGEAILDKYLSDRTVISTNEVYRMVRSIHREDRQRNIDKAKSLSQESLIKLKQIPSYKTFVEKTVNVKYEATVRETYKCILRHNFENLIKIESIVSDTSVDADIRERFEDIYKELVSSILVMGKLDSDKVPLKTTNPVTIIRHNFTEIKKIGEILRTTITDISVKQTLVTSYMGLIKSVNKVLGDLSDRVITGEEGIADIESLIEVYVEKLASDTIAMSKLLKFPNDKLVIKDVLTILGRLEFTDICKLRDRILEVLVEIDIDCILTNEEKLKHLDVLAEYRDLVSGCFFNRELLMSMMSTKEDISLSHTICSLHKDMNREMSMIVTESTSILAELNCNTIIATIFSNYLKVDKDISSIDKYNIEDRIKVFYE